jgi:winged helix DNA-binding protein
VLIVPPVAADPVRVARNHLATPAPRARAVDVVREVCGLQAQLLSAAELALSARVPELTQRDVRNALWSKRSLVRAWTVRGTIHIVAAADLPLWAAALGRRRFWESPEWLARYELTRREAAAIFDRVVDALDRGPLTREQIADAVVAKLGDRYRPRIASFWGDLLAPVTYMGKLCFGPSQGPNVTFVRADRWVDGWKDRDPDEAWAELARRYLRAYGPATVPAMARWFGIEPAEAERVLRALGGAIRSTERGWVLTHDHRTPRKLPHPSVRLVPQYDCYVMGCQPREEIVPVAVRDRIRTFKRGRWEGAAGVPVLIVDGIIAGVWSRTERRERIAIAVESPLRLTSAQRGAVRRDAERVGRFLGRPADVSLT